MTSDSASTKVGRTKDRPLRRSNNNSTHRNGGDCQGQAQRNTVHRNHQERRDTSKRSNIICTYCTHLGHSANRCFTRLRDLDKANITVEGLNTSAVDHLQHAALITRTTHNVTVDETNIWYFDTRASSHMMCNREWLHDYQPVTIEHNVILGNDLHLPVTGHGTIKATVYAGAKPVEICLPDIILVPVLRKNLLSPNKLLKNGYIVTLQENGCEVRHRSSPSPLFTVTERNNLLYVPLTAKLVRDAANTSHSKPGQP